MSHIGLLLLRVFAGCGILTHGWDKLTHFGHMLQNFPDPIGLGVTLSLSLVVFAEVGCSILVILGVMTRLAAIPIAFTMTIACFVALAGQPLQMRELPFVYLGIFLSLIIMGGGKFSILNLKKLPMD